MLKHYITSLVLFAVFLFSTLSFTQVRAQSGCVVSWGTTVSMCTVYFNNISTGGAQTAIYSYSWNFGDGQTFNRFDPVLHTYSASGTYSVCFTYGITTSSGTCTVTECNPVTVQCVPIGISSSEKVNLSLSVNNLVFYSADIHYSIPFSGNIKLVLFDIVGNKIGVLESGSKSAGVHSYSLSTGGFSKGIYFIHLDFEGATITKKIIIKE